MELTVADKIRQIAMGRPHVVLLGAGASRAAFPHGDRDGRRLPLMADFLEIVPVGAALGAVGIPWRSRDFESVYSDTAVNPELQEVQRALETAVRDYFSALHLPPWPTLYDSLVLGLREKDVIATFNWDPFLIQAAQRNARVARHPSLLFLHGNAMQGYCQADATQGIVGKCCPRCSRRLSPVPLLYPIRDKDYDAHPAIAAAWRAVRSAFKGAFMITIFGYGAPESDAAAIALLQEAWGGAGQRNMEQFELIDMRQEDDLVQRWGSFIHSHHYEVHSTFSESWIAKHPRRTGEAYLNQYINAAFIEDNPLPSAGSLEELWSWFQPLLEAEGRAVWRDTRRNS